MQISASGSVLTTTAPVKKNDVLLTVPESAWISAATAQVSPLGRALAAAARGSDNDDVGGGWQGLPPWARAALYLISLPHQETTTGGDLVAYVRSRPVPESPLLWGEEELSMWAGTQVRGGDGKPFFSFFFFSYQHIVLVLVIMNHSEHPSAPSPRVSYPCA